MTPYQLSEFRSALVNNQFLAVVTCSVQLHLHLDHMSVSLAKALTDFTEVLNNEMNQSIHEYPWFRPQKKRKMETSSNLNSVYHILDSIQNDSVDAEIELEDENESCLLDDSIHEIGDKEDDIEMSNETNPTDVMDSGDPPSFECMEILPHLDSNSNSIENESIQPLSMPAELDDKMELTNEKDELENDPQIIPVQRENADEILEIIPVQTENSDEIKDLNPQNDETKDSKDSKKRSLEETVENEKKTKILFWEDILSAPKVSF